MDKRFDAIDRLFITTIFQYHPFFFRRKGLGNGLRFALAIAAVVKQRLNGLVGDIVCFHDIEVPDMDVFDV